MSRHVVLTRASDVRREAIRFLWQGRVALSALNILAGAPGGGKSLLTAMLGAEVSRGELVGALRGTPQPSIFMSLEDDRAAVIKPRLEAAQADLNLISFLDVHDDENEDTVTFCLPDHLELLAEAVWRMRPALVVLDPISAVMNGAIDSHRDASVRNVLAPLAKLAQDATCAIIIVAHTNKAVGSDALRRVGGSIGFTGAPRNALLLAHDPNDPEGLRGSRRLLAHFKTNTGVLAPTLLFDVKPTLIPASLDEPESATARMELIGESELDSDDLLASTDQDERSETDEAVDLLREELAHGPRPAADMQTLASRAGIGKKALRRAKEQLGVKSRREGFGADGVWKWVTIDAPETSIDVLDAPSQKGGTLGAYGTNGAPMSDEEIERLERLGEQLGLTAGDAE